MTKEEKKEDRKAGQRASKKGDKKGDAKRPRLRECQRNADGISLPSKDGKDIEVEVFRAAGLLQFKTGDDRLAGAKFATPFEDAEQPRVFKFSVSPGTNFYIDITGLGSTGCDLEFALKTKATRMGPFLLCTDGDDCSGDAITVKVVEAEER